MAAEGMVASSHPLASQAGVGMLAAGGNFMDAAIATAAVLTVVEPYNSHLGGDVFMIVYSAKDGRVEAINGSGAAPRAARPELFAQGGIPLRGLAAASVPGAVHGWDAALKRYGTMPLAKVLEPAIHYAENGFPVNHRLHQTVAGAMPLLRRYPTSSQAVLTDGQPVPPGRIWRQPGLAKALRILAERGAEDFYQGEIAAAMAAFCAEHDGLITEDDLAGHETRILEPLETTYRGITVYEQPPVSQGHILLQELNLVEGFDLAGMGPQSADSIHVMVEAKKLAFADKDRYTGDPRRTDIPLAGMLSKEYAAERRQLISLSTAATPSAGDPRDHMRDTTYFCVADGEGNGVSFIQSLFHGFGCGVVVSDLGFFLNNRMTGFSLDPEHVNCLEPGKKTVHTLNAYMLFRNGRPWVIGGTPGGDVQVQTNLQIITALVDYQMNVQEAVEAPRWASGSGLDLAMEGRIGSPVADELRRRGHGVRIMGDWEQGGRVQLIMVCPESGAYMAGSDPRCDGCAIGI